jgi:hypothetical protein
MKTIHTARQQRTAVLGILALGLVGCATLTMTALNVRTECQSTASLTVMPPYVYQDKGGTLVSGQLRTKALVGHAVTKAHLHVVVLDGKGGVLNETVADVAGLPIRHNRFGGPESQRYSVRVPLVPPRNGTIRVTLHEAPAALER